ncbi:hypothetical protein N8806_01530 [Flavobacteriaceae bacterium]|nr:hypothetical protein [Flavobacteriaceae bacterium]
MLKIKGQRGIFVFSDPAGAKACLALVKSLKNKEILIISDRKYSFYSEFNLEVHLSKEKNVKDWVDFFKPDFIFTGTSMPEKIELNFIKEAKGRSIKTISFVDHWTNFKQRFLSNQIYIYPSQIWVIDEQAKQKALLDGIPENLIKISNNPYYEFLKKWKPSFNKEKLFKKLGLVTSSKYILFAPEPLSTFNLQTKYGFDEVSGLKHLDTTIENLGLYNIYIIVKGHPNQNHKLFLKYIAESKNNRIFYLKEFDLNHLIYYSEIVAGYFSNSLIEAKKMNKKVIRLLIDLKDFNLDPFDKMRIGEKVYTLSNLKDSIQKYI